MEIVLLLGFADTIFRRERSDDRKCVCASQATPPPSYLISSFDTSSFLFSLFFTIHNIHYFCNTKCFCKKARQGFCNHFKEHVNTSTPWEQFIITQILQSKLVVYKFLHFPQSAWLNQVRKGIWFGRMLPPLQKLRMNIKSNYINQVVQ